MQLVLLAVHSIVHLAPPRVFLAWSRNIASLPFFYAILYEPCIAFTHTVPPVYTNECTAMSTHALVPPLRRQHVSHAAFTHTESHWHNDRCVTSEGQFISIFATPFLWPVSPLVPFTHTDEFRPHVFVSYDVNRLHALLITLPLPLMPHA